MDSLFQDMIQSHVFVNTMVNIWVVQKEQISLPAK
jgi:hypothetical protein